MHDAVIDTDIAIVGGGIAGLWLLNHLSSCGYHSILLERSELGSEQTIASQGMIHGGIKYALGGGLTAASEAIADMPARWNDALDGKGHVNLSKSRVLSDHFYMWSSGKLGSRLSTMVAGKALRGRVDSVQRPDYPAVFADPGFQGKLLKLVDIVVDVPSILENLVDNYSGRIFKLDSGAPILRHSDGGHTTISTPVANIRAQKILLTAGVGNEALLAELGASAPKAQRRPLHQVVVKHEYQQPLYAHCMGRNPSPRLTISSHTAADGSPVWYLGGDLATENIDADPEALIAKANKELDQLFPWLDFGRRQWATLRIDRAEPKQNRLLKPDKSFAGAVAGTPDVIVCWPTKLALAPNLATEVDKLLAADDIKPKAQGSLELLSALGCPEIAQPCWNRLF
ncbi:MAG: glycine/D-amino acid oxidase-like deaminating enzyme [Halieaceae bacterium]|jgi:glycine/D-amino acid oxidase-like deaminating enzyme